VKYRVVLENRAEVQFQKAALWWAEHRSIEQADRWTREFTIAIDSLENNPQRHSHARENPLHEKELRQILFGLGRRPTHRAIFYIDGDVVRIVSVRHVAQGDLPTAEL
jgi:plasmid stabilization system protein ParE